MIAVLRNALILVLAFGVFVGITLILREDVPPPAWLPFDPQKDVWLVPLLKLFGTVLLAPPLAALIASLVMLGAGPHQRIRPGRDASGTTELRLIPGAKWTAAGLALMMFAGLVFALIAGDEPFGIWLFVSPMLAACLYGLILCFTVRARYDCDGLSSIYYLLRWQTNDWADLRDIRVDNGPGDVIFDFGDKGVQRLSIYYVGIGDCMRFAEKRVKEIDTDHA
ncbi:hypothetical protein GQ651_10090 [Alphaproteobacteria bacterium GH1-50]|uniref:Uncharacterized protein n=1 Tax=Kangsaoukella pontilimi TaxID=2691042 RepID=A0A7C9ME86_9RHOB|nr:hypothetical protein [Kangsaoukella pontilimi]MXQ08192.1 hypothetical protein [Kangsaoukella pontilimi]